MTTCNTYKYTVKNMYEISSKWYNRISQFESKKIHTVVIDKYTMKLINMYNTNLYSYKSEILQIQLF